MPYKINPFTGNPDYYDASSGGTVTSVASGTGLTGGPITTTGTLSVDSATVPYYAGGPGSAGFVKWNGTAWAIDTTSYVNRAGDTMTGSLILNADPTTALGAATKQYVDNIATGINFHAPVVAATTGPLPAVTYSNGVGGVGATLIATSPGALTIDTITFLGGGTERVLIKNQVSGLENGIYVVNVAGDGVTPFQLTRATDADNSPAGELAFGDFCFVEQGPTNGGFGYILNTTGTITVGVTALSYVIFNAAQVVTAGTGLTELPTNTLNIDINKVPYYSGGFSAGFVKWDGANWIFDNSTYLDTTTAASTYLTQVNAALQYYPLSSNPAGYLTSASLSAYVPYTGATGNVSLGAFSLTAAGVNISGLTANQILALDASKNIQTLTTATYPSLTELSYVKGVTSAVQTQINGKVSTGLATSSGLTMNTSRLLGRTTAGVGAIQEIELQTSGTSGPATLTGGILNIPDYSSGLTGYVPYTGATSSLQLGGQQLQVNTIYGTYTGTGNLDLRSNVALSGYVRFPDGGTSGIWTGDLVGSPAWSAIYVNPSGGNPASDNYTITSNSAFLKINSYQGDPLQEAIGFYIQNNYANGGISILGSSTNFYYAPVTSNNPTSFIVNIPSNTGQTASTNIPNFKVIGNTKQWATGAITNQYWNHFTANTAAFVLPSTITNSYGLYVEAATQGTNATITNNYALGLKGQFFADLDGTGKTLIFKESSLYTSYGWQIATSNSKLTIPQQIWIGDSSALINRFIAGGGNYGLLIESFKDIRLSSMSPVNTFLYCVGNTGHIGIGTTTPSERLTISGGNILLEDAGNFIVGSTTGTKIGTATNQKLGFYGVNPTTQPLAVTSAQEIADRLTDLGFLAPGSVVSGGGTNTGAAAALFNYYNFI